MLNKATERTTFTQIENLNSEAWTLNRKDPKKAIELSEHALKLAMEVNDQKGKAFALKTLGAANVWIANNDLALTYSFQAIELFKLLGDKKNEAQANYNIGANFSYTSDFDSSIKYYFNCYNISKEINDELGMADGLNGLGTIYYRIQENEKALEVLEESKNLCEKHGNKDIYIKVLDGLGETFYNIKKYDLSLENYIKSASISKELGNKQVESFALDGLGRTYAALKNKKLATENFNKSIQLRKEIGFKAGEVLSLLHLGSFYLDSELTTEAKECLNDALKLSIAINFKEGSYQAYEKLALIAEKEKDFKEAIHLYKKYISFKDEVNTEKSTRVVKGLEAQNKLIHSQKEKEILEEKTKELENFSNSLVLMSEIGQHIISSLSVETIVDTVYKNVNNLMDAAGFGIGIFNQEKNEILFPLYIEEKDRFNNLSFSLSDKNRLPVICFESKTEIVLNDYGVDIFKYIKNYLKPVVGKAPESLIYLPLTYQKKVLGIITVQSFSKNSYTEFHLNILRNIATYTAIAIENASLYNSMEQKVVERTTDLQKSNEQIERNFEINKKISEIGREITSNLSLGKIFKQLQQSVNEIMEADCFGVRIYHPEQNVVEYKYEYERGEIYTEEVKVPLTDDDNYTVWCIKNKKDIFLNDNQKEYSKYVKQIRVVSGEMPHSLLFTPMMLGEKILGVITVQSFKRNAYQPYQLDLLKTLATYTATALDNAYLYQYMEDKVKERTIEVVKQKEEIEKTSDNARIISEIGKEISNTFSIEEIIEKVYTSVNKLMDAAMFGIGIYDSKTNNIEFKGVIEKGVKLEDYSCSVEKDIDRPAVWCYNTQQDYIINSFTEEFIKSGKITDTSVTVGDATESILYVPITNNDKKVGVITVQSFTANAFTNYHLQLLKNLAMYAAIALDNASLYANMELRVKERTIEIEKNHDNTKLLGEIARELSSSLSIETIINLVYNNINGLMVADTFGIGMYNAITKKLEFNDTKEKGKTIPYFEIDVEDKNRLATICFQSQKEIVINDFLVEHSKYLKIKQKSVSGEDSASIIYLPLFSKKEIVGIISVQSFQKNAYQPYHVELLKNLCTTIGVALDNASLYQNLEEKVNQRTEQIVKQKEEIEKSNENTRLISEIGKEITSTFSINQIIEKVYISVNKIMDATMFGIGIYNDLKNSIEFKGVIEKGELLEDYDYQMADSGRPAVSCFISQKDLVINNFTQEYINTKKVRSRHSIPGQNTESIIYLPLTTSGKKIGVITVQSFNVSAYSEYHVQVLKSLAVYTAIALDNASLYNNLDQRVKERTEEIKTAYDNARLLSQIAEDISSSLSVQTIVAKVYKNVNKLLDATMFGIGIYNPANKMLEFKSFMENNQIMEDFSYSVNDKNRLAAICFSNKKEIHINDYTSEYTNYFKDIQAPISGKDSASIIYLPIYSKDNVIGVITVQSFEKNRYSSYHFDLIKNISVSAGIAIDNASLYQNLEEKIKERTIEVLNQKAIIEGKNKDITDSIKYAKKIQQAISPNVNEFNRNFSESFIHFKPKDIVSGDFFWFEHFDDITVFAAADCTGHGVPGAFMSLICREITNKIIVEQKTINPSEALKKIDERLVQLIKKTSENASNDGMDIALCAYHKNENKLYFSGAQRPLIFIRNNNLEEIKGSKFSIGGHSAENKKFQLHQMDVKQGDIFYLATDGYADQFGGANGKKLKFKNFKELLLKNYIKPFTEQKNMLSSKFEEWKGVNEQVDDVCVIGIKI
ncbi:MAG: GAF domain-containing protein [Bacteroidetes bacterium]|nr:GAF domain-containing protein [Bacteroidota bacterium]